MTLRDIVTGDWVFQGVGMLCDPGQPCAWCGEVVPANTQAALILWRDWAGTEHRHYLHHECWRWARVAAFRDLRVDAGCMCRGELRVRPDEQNRPQTEAP